MNQTPSKLLAKNLKHGELTLQQHLQDTEQAALAIFQNRILDNWCRFFQLQNPSQYILHLRIAALFHDLGKANLEFNNLVRGKPIKQTLRHEWISALILHLPSVRNWLSKSSLDREIITSAVLCHHLQASRTHWGKPQTPIPEISLYLHHQEIQNILQHIGQLAKIDGLPHLPEKWIAQDPIWNQTYQNANRIGAKFSRDIRKNPTRRALLLAVKAGVIIADSVASSIFRVENSLPITQWVKNTINQQPITPEEIETKILQPRYREIEKKSGLPFQLKPFQQKAKELSNPSPEPTIKSSKPSPKPTRESENPSPKPTRESENPSPEQTIKKCPRLLLTSGCGTGKTIFAYIWQQGVLKHHSVGHIIFLYPTRTTATAGFFDYIDKAPETEASLLTGTANYELQGMRSNPEKDYTTDARLYALGFWSKRFFCATVDQFLSFLTHNYSSICLLPVLADSIVVIDEIHSFSPRMFNNLIRFLEHFDIPVLCMTATLPTTRRQELTINLEKKRYATEPASSKRNQLGLDIFPTASHRSQLQELEIAETRPRYQIQSTDYDTAYTQAVKAYQQGKRILWVVNTVNRCQKTAKTLENDLQIPIFIYHSRYRLKDKLARHNQIINAFQINTFQKEHLAVIAVTTQICEMSLDLDADVLITEIAPITALIQRFGRSNRHSLIEYAQIWVYSPPEILPYDSASIQAAKQFLHDVSGKVSQRNLADKLEQHSLKEDEPDSISSFIGSGYWAFSESFREINNYCTTAILDSDLEEWIQLTKAKNPAAEGLIISVPKQYTFEPLKRTRCLPSYLKLADHTKYCPKRGFGESIQ